MLWLSSDGLTHTWPPAMEWAFRTEGCGGTADRRMWRTAVPQTLGPNSTRQTEWIQKKPRRRKYDGGDSSSSSGGRRRGRSGFHVHQSCSFVKEKKKKKSLVKLETGLFRWEHFSGCRIRVTVLRFRARTNPVLFPSRCWNDPKGTFIRSSNMVTKTVFKSLNVTLCWFKCEWCLQLLLAQANTHFLFGC